MFRDIYMARATIPHIFVAPSHLTNARKVFTFDTTKVSVDCRCGLILFDRVTVLRISKILIDERCILCVKVTFFVRSFFVGFDAKYLLAGYI